MKLLSLSAFIFWLSFNAVTHCLCLASNTEEEASSYEPDKKRHRINDLFSSFESSFLGVDDWNALPGELWIHIFNYLSFHNLEIAKSVCKAWQELGNDEWLSLSKQIKAEPLSFLLKKLEDSKEGQDGFYQEFFNSPVALVKLLLDSRALEDILANPSLIPLLFKSKLTASAIYEALSKNTLEKRQQTALEAYVETAPIFSPKESLFSQAFITFAQECAPLYKALYLLDLFHLPSAKPIKDLFKQADQEIKRQKTFRNKNEEELILLPKAMTFFSNMPHEKAYNLAEYCFAWRGSSTQTLKNEWLRLAKLFYCKSALQGNTVAQFKLSVLLDEQGEFDQSKTILFFMVEQGDAKAQTTLGFHYQIQGKDKKAACYFRQAANKGDGEAQYNLGCLLEKQGQSDEAAEYYRYSAEQGCELAQNALGLCLENKGDFSGAFRNYTAAVKQGYKLACLNLAYLLEHHPEIFTGSQEARTNQIMQLREQGNASLKDWLQSRS